MYRKFLCYCAVIIVVSAVQASDNNNLEKQLFSAITLADVDQVKKLAKEKVRINTRNEAGRTPLHVAVARYHENPQKYDAIIETLLSVDDVDVNAKGGIPEETPLQFAVRRYVWSPQKYQSIINTLLDVSSLNINTQDEYGNTPLHEVVIQYGVLREVGIAMNMDAYVWLMQALLSRGADPTISNTVGYTAIELAQKYKLFQASVVMSLYSTYHALEHMRFALEQI